MKRKSLKIFISLLVIAAVCFALVTVSIVSYGRKDEKQPCDAIVVLGASSWNGQVSPVFRERINHGIWLYENGYADYIIFTGGYGEGSSVSESGAAKIYALSQGVPEDVIFIEEKSRITEENMKYAKEIMDEHSWETVILVSDPLHMKRAMLMANDYGITAYSSPTPTSMYRSAKTQLPFLGREVFFYIEHSVVRLFR